MPREARLQLLAVFQKAVFAHTSSVLAANRLLHFLSKAAGRGLGSGGSGDPSGADLLSTSAAPAVPLELSRLVLSAATVVARIDYYSTKATRPYLGPDRRLGNNAAPEGFHLYLFSSYIMLKKSPAGQEARC